LCYVDVKLLGKDEKVSLDELLERLSRIDEKSEVGAFSIFVGTVKGRVGEALVNELVYTAISDAALRRLHEIAMETCIKYSARAVVIYHRIGSLKPGETTIYIIVMGESRRNTSTAVIEALERVKSEVPIFKLEKRSDGEYWVIGDGVRYKRAPREN